MNQMGIASILPLLVFFLYNFKLYNMPYIEWKNAFLISGFLAIFVMVFFYIKKR